MARRPLARSRRLCSLGASRVIISSTLFRDDNVYGITIFVGVLDTGRRKDECDCYRKMLEAGHFDLDAPATSSGDDDKIVTDELAVVRDNLARARRVEGRRG